jgi:hypothetical protein
VRTSSRGCEKCWDGCAECMSDDEAEYRIKSYNARMAAANDEACEHRRVPSDCDVCAYERAVEAADERRRRARYPM